jgi:hypothetical protein
VYGAFFAPDTARLLACPATDLKGATVRHLVKITDAKHEWYGQILSGDIIYYDMYHTGHSPDVYYVENGDRI